MILGRIALFLALLLGVATTQMPEFWQQYRQRLGAAIDELTAIVGQFDKDAAGQNLAPDAAIARLEANADPLVEARGDEMKRILARLAKLRRGAAAFNDPNVAGRWVTLLRTFDPYIAERTYQTFQPAIPATPEGFVAGIVGFLVGGGIVYGVGLPIRHRHALFGRRSRSKAAEPYAEV